MTLATVHDMTTIHDPDADPQVPAGGPASGRPYPPPTDPSTTELVLTLHIAVPAGAPLPPALARLLLSLAPAPDPSGGSLPGHALVPRLRPVAALPGAGSGGHAPVGPPAAAAVTIDLASRSVRLDGQPLPLTRREYELLVFFCRNPRRAFNRSQLLRQVWGYPPVAGERTVDVHVRRLRAKLDGRGPTIETVRGYGYRLDNAAQARLCGQA